MPKATNPLMDVSLLHLLFNSSSAMYSRLGEARDSQAFQSLHAFLVQVKQGLLLWPLLTQLRAAMNADEPATCTLLLEALGPTSTCEGNAHDLIKLLQAAGQEACARVRFLLFNCSPESLLFAAQGCCIRPSLMTM